MQLDQTKCLKTGTRDNTEELESRQLILESVRLTFTWVRIVGQHKQKQKKGKGNQGLNTGNME